MSDRQYTGEHGKDIPVVVVTGKCREKGLHDIDVDDGPQQLQQLGIQPHGSADFGLVLSSTRLALHQAKFASSSQFYARQCDQRVQDGNATGTPEKDGEGCGRSDASGNCNLARRYESTIVEFRLISRNCIRDDT